MDHFETVRHLQYRVHVVQEHVYELLHCECPPNGYLNVLHRKIEYLKELNEHIRLHTHYGILYYYKKTFR